MAKKQKRPKTVVWYRRSANGETDDLRTFRIESCFETNEHEIDMLASDCAEDFYEHHNIAAAWSSAGTFYQIFIEIFEDEACEKSLGKFLASPIVTVGFVADKVDLFFRIPLFSLYLTSEIGIIGN